MSPSLAGSNSHLITCTLFRLGFDVLHHFHLPEY